MSKNQSKGLLFYTDDVKPLPELVVALYSAEKHIKEDIFITLGPKTPDKFEWELAKAGYHCHRLVKRPFHTGRRSRIGHWFQKPFVIRDSPHDLTLYFDCDHLFFRAIPDETWAKVDEYGLSTGHVENDPLQRPKYYKWMNYINVVSERRVFAKRDWARYSRMNGGCIGFAKNERGHTHMKTWIWFLNKFHELPNNKEIIYLGDESALSATINMNRYGWLGDTLSRTRHPYHQTVDEIPADIVAWHYARSQYTTPDLRKILWLNTYKEAYHDDFLGLRTLSDFYLGCNSSVTKELISEIIPCLQ